ncbi:MAG: SlyX family protein [Alphaproteobacteria bacterium]|jgi:SlyX protein|nr:SlyX family protein [Alphaproteobacteria bacterium]
MEQRVTELESRLAHQERMIEDMNEVLVAQRETVERLERELDAVRGYLRDRRGQDSTFE